MVHVVGCGTGGGWREKSDGCSSSNVHVRPMVTRRGCLKVDSKKKTREAQQPGSRPFPTQRRSFTAGRLRHYFRRRRPQRPVSHDVFPRRRGRTYLYYFRRRPLSSHQQAGRHPSGYISGVNRERTVRRLSAVFLKLLFTLARRYGAQVEDFLKVYLRTPGLPQEDVTKALLARGAARRAAAEKLMVRAHEGTSTLKLPASRANRRDTDFQTLSRLDPSNRQVQSLLQLSKQVRPSSFQHPLYLNRF